MDFDFSNIQPLLDGKYSLSDVDVNKSAKDFIKSVNSAKRSNTLRKIGEYVNAKQDASQKQNSLDFISALRNLNQSMKAAPTLRTLKGIGNSIPVALPENNSWEQRLQNFNPSSFQESLQKRLQSFDPSSFQSLDRDSLLKILNSIYGY